ncbi:MAG: holo-ACP synthase [Erysipelotrichaceae bacterium]|nr:holo-ACP synthase [Erysipelotrichaceae bacterium]
MKNVGIDIVENERVRKALSDAFVKKVLSQEERKRFEGFKETRKVEFLAGRFAAKEAIIKCLSGIEVPQLTDLNIENDEAGRPFIQYKDYEIVLSISHERNYSVAIAILN